MVTLEGSKLFGQLSREELSALRWIAKERKYAAGEVIFKEGDIGDGVYIVKDGLVEISAMIGQSVRHVFAQIGPGDIFGEMAVLDYKPRSASATALKETAVYFIARMEILKFIERSPVLAMNLLREISNRLREFNRQYLREMLQAERLAVIGRFARSIVHDLKNPLNIIGLTAEMAGMEQSTPEMRKRSKAIIRAQVERITDLVGEILEFTQGGSQGLGLAAVDYETFVEQVVQEIRPEVALKSVLVEMEEPLPSARVEINPKRIRRVFDNLLCNATDAMPQGGKVFVRVQLNSTDVVTEIQDSGPGIAPEIAGRLFEAFATYGKVHGTGLGLSICKRILEDHRGWIRARNEPGRGAVFAFGLPLSKNFK